MNDPVYVDLALHLAERAMRSASTGDAEVWIKDACRRLLAREPDASELVVLLQVYTEQRQRLANDPSAVDRLLATITPNDRVQRTDLAAMYYVATILLNLDEAVTKP